MSNPSNLDKSPPELLIYWIEERYKIYQAKLMGEPAPWSDNPVMQETYFCNVHRENDKVTKWIRSNFDEWCGLPVFNTMIARMVNKPSSLKDMDWPFVVWNDREQGMFLRTMSQKGAWGSAYIVSTNGRAMPKHTYICELLTGVQAHVERAGNATTLAAAHKALMQVNGLGSFMAAQIVADLKNTKGHPLADASDWWTWCAHGPGSLRGMAWVLWGAETEKCAPKYFNRCMPWLREYVDEELSEAVPKFCNQDLQNCLCEFDKFMRVTNGTGRSKRKYNGRG